MEGSLRPLGLEREIREGMGGSSLPSFTPFLHLKRVPSWLGPGGRLGLGEGLAEVFAAGLWGEPLSLG